jgi:hypothetical protein
MQLSQVDLSGPQRIPQRVYKLLCIMGIGDNKPPGSLHISVLEGVATDGLVQVVYRRKVRERSG